MAISVYINKKQKNDVTHNQIEIFLHINNYGESALKKK